MHLILSNSGDVSAPGHMGCIWTDLVAVGMKIVIEEVQTKETEGLSKSLETKAPEQVIQLRVYQFTVQLLRMDPFLLQRNSRNETEKRERKFRHQHQGKKRPSRKTANTSSFCLTCIVVGFIGLATQLETSV